MLFTPNTEVYLLNTPLENNYKNQLTFSNKVNQRNYFQNKQIKYIPQCTYVRKDNVMSVPFHIESIYNVNYCMYKNSNYSDKWFYAFVTNMEYKNDGTTWLTLETDVWQTWMFDVTLKPSFVEREHVADDTIGLHTTDEGLAYGEYVCNNLRKPIQYDVDSLCYYLGTTVNPNNGNDLDGGSIYNGIYSGVKYYRYDRADLGKEVVGLNEAINKITNGKGPEAITGIFMGPKSLGYGTNLDGDHSVPQTAGATNTQFSIPKTRNINGYTPKNNKLKVFPYCFLRASNNAGSNAIYKYEYFNNEGECWFEHREALTPGISARIHPLDYKGVEVNYDEGLSQGKFPICNFAVDMYTNWQTQNANNQTFDLLMGVGTMVAGAGTAVATGATGVGIGVGASMMVSGVTQIFNTLNNDYKASLMPDQVKGNTNCGDVNTSAGINGIFMYEMSIKKEYAEIIDNFFEMYGYKVNVVKVPNITSRPSWNYIKTIDCNIDGNCPQDDLNKIRSLFDNGITFWHGDWVEDYSKNNH